MLRVVFMGTPDFAVPTLEGIVAAKHQVVAVYTQPPRRAGRGMGQRKSPVHICAERAGIPVSTPATLRDEAQHRAIAAHGADVVVVVAYGLILPREVLGAPRDGCLNLHASLLPRWRGAAPIQRAIMAGDEATAATVMRMDEGLDTGPVCALLPVPIGRDTTAGELHDTLAQQGAALTVNALADLARGALTCTPQPAAGITYASKIDASETAIDFARSAQQVHDHIRALSPVPGAWFTVQGSRDTARNTARNTAREGHAEERIKVVRAMPVAGAGVPGTVLGDKPGLSVACGTGAVRLLELQRAGKRPMPADAFLRGYPLSPGTRLHGR